MALAGEITLLEKIRYCCLGFGLFWLAGFLPLAFAQAALDRTDAPLNQRFVLQHERKVTAMRKFRERVRFAFGQAVTYDDNIFTAPRGRRKSDVIFSPAVGIRLRLFEKTKSPASGELRVSNDFRLGINYVGSYEAFLHHSELNGFNHNVTLDTGVNPLVFHKKLSFTVTESFTPQSYLRDDSSGRQKRGQRISNTLGATLEYPFKETTKLVLPYRNIYSKNFEKDARSFDSMTHNIGPGLQHEFTPKTSGSTRLEITSTGYKDSKNNYRSFTPWAGIGKEITSKAVFRFDNGYQFRSKKQGPNIHGYVFTASYQHQISPRTSFGLDAARSITEALADGTASSGGRTINEAIEEENPTLISYTMGSHIRHFWTDKIAMRTSHQWTFDSQTTGAKDKNFFYRTQCGVAYYLNRSFTLNFDYILSLRDADKKDSSYARNAFVVGLNYGFGGMTP